MHTLTHETAAEYVSSDMRILIAMFMEQLRRSNINGISLPAVLHHLMSSSLPYHNHAMVDIAHAGWTRLSCTSGPARSNSSH
jgi:hypothetical protein